MDSAILVTISAGGAALRRVSGPETHMNGPSIVHKPRAHRLLACLAFVLPSCTAALAYADSIALTPSSPTSLMSITYRVDGANGLFGPPVFPGTITVTGKLIRIDGCTNSIGFSTPTEYMITVSTAPLPAGHYTVEYWRAFCDNDGQVVGAPTLRASLGFTVEQAIPSKYRVVSVGLINGNGSVPKAINAAGDIIGSAGGSNTVPATPFLFQNDRVTDFGALGLGTADAINDLGQVVGTRAQGPYIYDHGVVTNLPALGTQLVSTAINNLGQVVGYTSLDGKHVPYLFHDGVATTLDIPTGLAIAINDSGVIAGAVDVIGIAQHGFVFENGQALDIGTLGGNGSYPNAINRAGTVVGASSRSDGVVRAFMYRNGAFTDLGSIPAAGRLFDSATAYGINSYDDVVGESNGVGFLWQVGAIYDLNTLLADGYTDWSIMRGTGINDAGQIAAWGCQKGAQTCNAIRLEPVDPPVRPASPRAVEYYNAALDHYFMTASSDEIGLLDNGAIVGWKRTGAYMVVRAAGDANANPVCRFYIPPAYGDSHFFSASSGECRAVAAKFPWVQLESSDVFNVMLPDRTTGLCSAGDSPVYRVWNGRMDSNHRYTMNWIARDAMIAKGYIAEGYGTVPAAMCAQ